MQKLEVGKGQRCLEVGDGKVQGPVWAVAPQKKKEERDVGLNDACIIRTYLKVGQQKQQETGKIVEARFVDGRKSNTWKILIGRLEDEKPQ